jgi:hypothetical protein
VEDLWRSLKLAAVLARPEGVEWPPVTVGHAEEDDSRGNLLSSTVWPSAWVWGGRKCRGGVGGAFHQLGR